jgi:hypothetical protein
LIIFGREKDVFGLGGFMLAFTFENELLSNELVGSALLVLDVIRCFYVLDLALSLRCLLLTVSRTNDGALVTAIYIGGGGLDPQEKKP